MVSRADELVRLASGRVDIHAAICLLGAFKHRLLQIQTLKVGGKLQ